MIPQSSHRIIPRKQGTEQSEIPASLNTMDISTEIISDGEHKESQGKRKEEAEEGERRAESSDAQETCEQKPTYCQ
jgi:hypothetical protein